MKTVHMVRKEPVRAGGAVESDAPESAVDNYKKRGWRIDDRKQGGANSSETKPKEENLSADESKQGTQKNKKKDEPKKEEQSFDDKPKEFF